MKFIFGNKYKLATQHLGILVLVSIFLAILFLNVMTPHIADDYGYMFYFGAGYPKYINSVSDLIGSQYNHYHMWGGRVIGHGIAQILLRIPTIITSVLNTFVYMLFVLLIYKHIVGKEKGSINLFVLINLFVWFFIPAFGDTILWVTGSANYLWCTTIILAFLYLYRYPNNNSTAWYVQIVYTLLFLVFGVVVGWTNENTVLGLIVMLALLIGKQYSQTKRISIWYISGIIGVGIGYLFLILAPGNTARASIDLSLFVLFKRFITITTALFVNYGWILIVLIALILGQKKRFLSSGLKVIFETPILYIIGALISTYVMLASPQFPERSWFAIVVFLLIAMGILVRNNLNIYHSLALFFKVSCLVGIIGFIFSYMLAVKDIYTVKEMISERENIASLAIENGKNVAYFKPIKTQSRYVHGEDDETNFLLSYYYKIYIDFEK